MPKFDRGEFVAWGKGGERVLGWVLSRKGPHYKVMTFARRIIRCHSRQLSRGRPAVLLLESDLSTGRSAIRSDKQRRSNIFLEELLRSFDVLPLRAKVHSTRALEHFMKEARKPDVWCVHFGGHGYHEPGKRGPRSGICLTTEEIYLPARSRATLEREASRRKTKRVAAAIAQYDNIDRIFGAKNLAGKILVFSACELGKRNGLAAYISKVSKATAVIAYDGGISDDQANVAEAMLYWQILKLQSNRSTPTTFVKKLRETTQKMMGIRLPIACFVDGARTAP